jgi:hypothetical protein
LNDEFVRVSDVPEERRRGLNEDPIDAPNDNTILSTLNAPLFTIPPPNSPPKEEENVNVAVVSVVFDITVVFVRFVPALTGEDVRTSITFSTVPLRCPVALSKVLHLNIHVPQYV